MQHTIVSQAEWLAARRDFLDKEKAFTRARDALSAARRDLPWVKVEKDYRFDSAQGPISLADLFGRHSQLMIYHFMLGPGWKAGCPSCSYLADHFDGAIPHLAQRDVRFAVVSHAPTHEIEAYKKRMGWQFDWVSSSNNSFNFDFNVSFTPEDLAGAGTYNFGTDKPNSEEMPGLSCFIRDGGDIYRTYSTYARGLDIIVGTYNMLDLAPKGRDEDKLPWTMAWVRRHDEYDTAAAKPAASCCG